VEADIAFFASMWLKDRKNRAVLIDARATHLGFTIRADGAGKKVAVVLLGGREGR
jgi:hypothetical protein